MADRRQMYAKSLRYLSMVHMSTHEHRHDLKHTPSRGIGRTKLALFAAEPAQSPTAPTDPKHTRPPHSPGAPPAPEPKPPTIPAAPMVHSGPQITAMRGAGTAIGVAVSERVAQSPSPTHKPMQYSAPKRVWVHRRWHKYGARTLPTLAMCFTALQLYGAMRF